jgi:putative endonuclease
MTYSVYILNSEKLDRFYIGFTSNLEKRLEFHLNAESHKFTYNTNLNL